MVGTVGLWCARMIKLSITLPAGAQVCIESDDRELVREVLHTFMPQLTGANGEPAAPVAPVSAEPPAPYANGYGPENGAVPNAATDPAAVRIEPVTPPPAPPTAHPAAVQPAMPAPAPAPAERAGAANGALAAEPATAAEREFLAFCQQVNPLGDMRKVVVAAEAAHRYLNVNSVDPDELSHLFTLAGWPIPHSFVQTLRNAARTKFRWLERIPGLPGHYKVTNTGRSIVLGDGGISSESG